MRRALFTAALLIAFTPLSLCAQRGGFGMAPRIGGSFGIRSHGAGGFHGGFGFRSGGGFRSGFGFRNGFAFGGNPRVRVIVNRRFPRRRFFRSGFFGDGFFPFVSYPYYPLGYYDSFSYAQQPAYTPQYDTGLATEVYRLQAEVDDLRREQALRAQQQEYASAPPPRPPAASPAAPERTAPATVLVYRDGRKSEVRNYAIVGETLWILSEQRAQKVPLADLNLEATRQANDERGVEFAIPTHRPAK